MERSERQPVGVGKGAPADRGSARNAFCATFLVVGLGVGALGAGKLSSAPGQLLSGAPVNDAGNEHRFGLYAVEDAVSTDNCHHRLVLPLPAYVWEASQVPEAVSQRLQ